jgi:hypothetical protein
MVVTPKLKYMHQFVARSFKLVGSVYALRLLGVVVVMDCLGPELPGPIWDLDGTQLDSQARQQRVQALVTMTCSVLNV